MSLPLLILGLYLGVGVGLCARLYLARDRTHHARIVDWIGFLVMGLLFWPIALVLS